MTGTIVVEIEVANVHELQNGMSGHHEKMEDLPRDDPVLPMANTKGL